MDILNIILLLLIVVFIYREITQYSEYYYRTDPYLSKLHDRLKSLHPKLQTIDMFEGDESYTLNKQKVYICLKDKKVEYYDSNMLTYVICHEYAHVLCKNIDETTHSKEFFEIFDELLQKAQKAGLYDPSIPPIKNYCMK